ncbi:uncharacterized protein SETTUDRAFT_169283 [Exserohilum turcica Et28A]|uniref:Uncharacterized protein n=1 Tax=Exserohilum turcicum (strain 28A) TaxID=671987 RepID=R0IN25_EXST2|nr:uncharacterized protein SETTUDRAFT_169283 [Exserohilum turcica Et28A]EOA86171.1 hypothetical protein SETTUDRAFT_169283 [Exserohilum turcica Et28A]
MSVSSLKYSGAHPQWSSSRCTNSSPYVSSKNSSPARTGHEAEYRGATIDPHASHSDDRMSFGSRAKSGPISITRSQISSWRLPPKLPCHTGITASWLFPIPTSSEAIRFEASIWTI